MEELRIGIIGAGNIASAFAKGTSGCQSAHVTAIGSRDLEKAHRFAEGHGLETWYGSYGELLEDPEVDAVYVATPNSAHKEWAIRAAHAKKHILCEKPIALRVEDAREMFDAARACGVVLVEAFPFRFQPQTIAVLDQVRSGAIGEVISFSGCFGFCMKNEENVRLIPELGGGSLWDVGVYPINLARAVFGEPPVAVLATGKRHPKGVDLTAAAILEYSNGRSATVWSSFETGERRRAEIVGTEGAIDYSFSNHTMPGSATYLLQIGKGDPILTECEFGNGFALEAEAFAQLLFRRGHFDGVTEQESIENTATAAAAVAAMRSGCRESISL